MTVQCAATLAKGTGRRPERQGEGDGDQAHSLVEDHRLQRREPEGADQ